MLLHHEARGNNYARLAALYRPFVERVRQADSAVLSSPLELGKWMVSTNKDVHDALMELERRVSLSAANDWLDLALIESGRFERKSINSFTSFKG